MNRLEKGDEGKVLKKKRGLGKIRDVIADIFEKKGGKEKPKLNESINLPRKNGEKVVVVRSDGEQVLGVIDGIYKGKYNVCYMAGDKVYSKQLSEDELANNEKDADIKELESSVIEGPDYKMGEEVMIPRSSGKISKGYIVGYIEKEGIYIVGFVKETKENGYMSNGRGKMQQVSFSRYNPAYKELKKQNLDKYNKE